MIFCFVTVAILTSSISKESACRAGEPSSIPGSGGSPGEGNGYLLWCSCLGNPMDRGAWWTTIHGVTKELDMTAFEHNECSRYHCLMCITVVITQRLTA